MFALFELNFCSPAVHCREIICAVILKRCCNGNSLAVFCTSMDKI